MIGSQQPNVDTLPKLKGLAHAVYPKRKPRKREPVPELRGIGKLVRRKP